MSLAKIYTSPSNNQLGGILRGVVVLIFVIGLALTIAAFVFGAVVPLGSVGMRQIAFGPGQGLIDRPLRPGFHWTVPGYSRIYLVPSNVQIINFEAQRSELPNSFDVLDIPTIDGTTVNVDVSLLIRFFDAAGESDGVKHEGPAALINLVGPTQAQWYRYITQVANDEIKRALSSLSTVEFYNPKARETRVAAAEAAMRQRLAPFGVGVEAVLVRRYTYRQEIDQAIFKKNLQELEMAFNKVSGEFAEAARDVNKVSVDGDVEILNLEKRGVAEADQIRSTGDLYRREKQAAGDLLVAEARAQVEKLKNDALAQSGSDIYVALQAAQLLSTLKGGVINSVDPLDFDGLVKKLLKESREREGTVTVTQ